MLWQRVGEECGRPGSLCAMWVGSEIDVGSNFGFVQIFGFVVWCIFLK